MKQIPLNGDDGRLELDLPCVKRSIEDVRLKVTEFAHSRGFKEEAGDIALVVQEACKNVIEHARPPDGNIHVECLDAGDRMVMEVSDNGRGFDVEKLDHEPSSPMAIRGRGVKLMKGLMDGFSITSNPGGTRVRMEKKRGAGS
jgi:anti-sigma regulatory factor (Ser/Thr protein kinase)